MQDTNRNTDTYTGTVTGVRYQGDDGWTVATLEDDQQSLTDQTDIPIVGDMPGVHRGARVTVEGTWTTHAKYGDQLQVHAVEIAQPKDPDGIAAWLDETVTGIGPAKGRAIAEAVCDTDGDIDADTIRAVECVRQELADRAADAWDRDNNRRVTMTRLQSMGLSAKQAKRAYKEWGGQAAQKVEANPYVLCDLRRIGFKRADQIADQMGIQNHDPQRLRAGLVYTLDQSRQDGHVGLPASTLRAEAAGILDVAKDKTAGPVDEMTTSGELVAQHGLVYRPTDADDEQTVADRLADIDAGEGDPAMSSDEASAWLDASGFGTMTDEQRLAFTATMTGTGLVTLTGGPGTGKTYTLDAICQAWPDDRPMHLASPTGRAAKRMTEVTGEAAETIHRLLDYRPEPYLGFHAELGSLEGLVIVDETSMLDTSLAARLFERVADTATVLLVGDPDQLPSVGPGYVLQDILDGPVGETCRLTKIHRQAQGSGIVQVAYQINDGRTPDLDHQHDDLGVVKAHSSEYAARAVDATADRLAEKGFDLREDVQILAPMYASAAGVDKLNAMMQAKVHDGTPSATRTLGGTDYAVGDRVMQTRNNYELGVMNGGVGVVLEVIAKDTDTDTALIVDVDGRDVHYTAYQVASELTLAYACTIHRAQGSEYPATIVVLTASHWIMCERTLLYTAITRAEDFGVLIAEPRALERACQHHSPVDRHRALVDRLDKVGC